MRPGVLVHLTHSEVCTPMEVFSVSEDMPVGQVSRAFADSSIVEADSKAVGAIRFPAFTAETDGFTWTDATDGTHAICSTDSLGTRVETTENFTGNAALNRHVIRDGCIRCIGGTSVLNQRR